MNKLFFCLLVSFCTMMASDTFEPVLTSKYDEQKAYIGKKLFFDKRLSPTENYSCETCHNLYWNLSGTNSSYNSQKGVLNPPSVLNAALNFIFYTDGRARNLKDQVSESLNSRTELNSNKDEIVKKVKSIGEYQILFENAYEDGIKYKNIVDALVEFEKAVLSVDSPFDEYMSGNEDAVDSEAKKGFETFKKIGCVACHNGRNLGGNLMQDVDRKDLTENRRLLRVPSLRNVTRTAPYLSGGSMNDLKDIIRYISAMQLQHPLSDEELGQIYKFLQTLNGRRPRILNE